MTSQQSGYPYPQQPPPPPGFFLEGLPHFNEQSYPTARSPHPEQQQFTGPKATPTPSTTEAAAANKTNLQFSNKTIRNAFIRKVYSILMVQLAITAFFIALFMNDKNTRQMVASRPSLIWVAFGVTVVCLLVIICCEKIRRTTPANYIFLFIFTIAESFLLGVISAKYRSTEILLAVGITAVVCFALTVFAFQTKVDFTVVGGTLFIATIILIIFAVILMFFPDVKPLRIIYACFGAFLFSIYLIYDTQLMIGGSHQYSISPEDYVFAALNLYIDIINIFLYILSIIGEAQD